MCFYSWGNSMCVDIFVMLSYEKGNGDGDGETFQIQRRNKPLNYVMKCIQWRRIVYIKQEWEENPGHYLYNTAITDDLFWCILLHYFGALFWWKAVDQMRTEKWMRQWEQETTLAVEKTQHQKSK